MKSREIRLVDFPEGKPTLNNFELVETDVREPGKGGVLVRNIWMSVDPYMRGRMRVGSSHMQGFTLGEVMDGAAIGRVEVSNHEGFSPGDYVLSMKGWRECFVSNGECIHHADAALLPLQSLLGTLGMPGLTAYCGLLRIGKLQEGERVFVSAASGAVGAVACQIAKAKGCYVVGSAGSPDKCSWLMEEVKVDRSINYKECDDLAATVADAFPEGIDLYFDNVGGAHLESALESMRTFGRLVLCGMISQYNAVTPAPGPRNLMLAVRKRLRLEGFIVRDHEDMSAAFREDMSRWFGEGRMIWRETVREGIENSPQAFIDLFTGGNFGKMLVKLSEG